MMSSRRFTPSSAAHVAAAALAAATLLLSPTASADNGRGNGNGNGNGDDNGRGNGNAACKEKVKTTRGLERAAAVADSIANETGRDPDHYLTYSAGLDQTLSEFSEEQIQKIVDGE